MTRIIVFCFLILIGCNHKSQNETNLPEKERWLERASSTEIIRDDYGVPHIYGTTDADAVFGLLYAQCEDDFNRVEQNYIWALGRLAEINGEKALYSDLRARMFMTKEEAIENFEKSPEWLQKLCIAFADGINYYLYSHPEVKPKLIDHFEPWMPMYFSEGSIGGDIERISTQKIKKFYEEDQGSEMAEVYDGILKLDYGESQGSNGFAISGKLTSSGNTMLLINPHTSFFFRGEVHVVSKEGLNAYGAVTWGQFFVYQGFNEKTGWMHTSTGTDIMDEFEETIIDGAEGLQYVYGEEKRKVETIPVKLSYKTENGLKENTYEIYRTHHGPITHASEDKWVATAMMWDPVKALQQSFIRTKQKNHQGFKKMMDMRTNSSNNTVFADASGNIAYYHGNFIPVRNPKFDYSEPVNGSDPATDWQGLHKIEENILIENPENGWIQNCNSTPFTAAGDYSPKPENYPAYMTSFPENYRGVHAISLLSKAEDLTLDKLIELAYDPFLPGGKALVKGLLEAAAMSPVSDPRQLAALEVLDSWDFKANVNSVAMTLCQFYLNAYTASGYAPYGRRDFMRMISYMSKESSAMERLEVFNEALDRLESHFGSWKTPWGEYNRYQRINGDIEQKFNDDQPSIPIGMASGIWGALASYTSTYGENTKRVYGVHGNSFVSVVEFGEKIRAKSLLAGGQSGDPKSPHFDDQVALYANGEFKTVAYYREDVIQRATARYKPGEKND